MKIRLPLSWSISALSVLATVAFAGAPNELTSEEKAAGWKLLFDGKTTEGWVSLGKTELSAGWMAEGGVLKRVNKAGDIVTKQQFTDFELTWEWNIEKAGNSGVKYNLPDPTKGVGFEYQLLDDVGHPDGVKGGRLHQTAGLYDLIEPAADKKLNPPGEWNSSRIVVNGQHVEHWLNGQKTVDFEMGSEDLKARIAKSKFAKTAKFGEKTSSPILIQEHGSAIELRSIKIRPLPAK